MARIVSLTVLTTLIVFLGITFFQVIAPFLLPLFLAGVAAILCQPIYRYFCRRTKQRRRIAAGLTTFVVLSIVFLPLLVGTLIGALQLYTLNESVGKDAWNAAAETIRRELEIDHIAERLEPHVGKVDPAKLQEQLRENVTGLMGTVAARSLGLAKGALGVFGAVLSVLLGVLMFGIGLYYFLADGPVLLSAAQALIPVQVDYQRQLLSQFDRVVRSVVIATFLAALAQGLMTAVALWLCGFGHFFIFFMVSMLAALIPLAGTWLVWGPCAIWLAYNGYWPSAILLTVFGAGVIGMADNVIRTYVLQSDTKLHPLLAFVSVLGGLQAMGLWGIFIGPTVACCLHALVKIFNTELKAFSEERFAGLSRQPARIESTASSDEAEPEPETKPPSESAGDVTAPEGSDGKPATTEPPPTAAKSAAKPEANPQQPRRRGKRKKSRRSRRAK